MSRREEIYKDLKSQRCEREFHSGLVPGRAASGREDPRARQYAKEIYAKSGKQADVLLQEIGDDESITLQGMIIR